MPLFQIQLSLIKTYILGSCDCEDSTFYFKQVMLPNLQCMDNDRQCQVMQGNYIYAISVVWIRRLLLFLLALDRILDIGEMHHKRLYIPF